MHEISIVGDHVPCTLDRTPWTSHPPPQQLLELTGCWDDDDREHFTALTALSGTLISPVLELQRPNSFSTSGASGVDGCHYVHRVCPAQPAVTVTRALVKPNWPAVSISATTPNSADPGTPPLEGGQAQPGAARAEGGG